MDRPTSASPKDIGGHMWHCYHTGILRTEWRTDGGLWAAGRRGQTSTYWARIGDRYLSTRFRTIEAAMRAAIKAEQANV